MPGLDLGPYVDSFSLYNNPAKYYYHHFTNEGAGTSKYGPKTHNSQFSTSKANVLSPGCMCLAGSM